MHKENIWLKKKIEEYDDEKCYLICFLNFHELPRNPSAVWVYILAMDVCISCWGGGGVRGVRSRTGFSQNS
jgi:hypothetical protein